MILVTDRLTIRPMQREDVDELAAWPSHPEPLLNQYNPPPNLTAQDNDAWYRARAGDPARREFAIENEEGQVIGRIGLREIDGRGTARLGIGLRADQLDRGLGSEALAAFLDWYFTSGNFKRMVLDVAVANARAVHVYTKLGFRRVTDRYHVLGNESAAGFLDDPIYQDIRDQFYRENGQVWQLYHEMELTREAWLESVD